MNKDNNQELEQLREQFRIQEKMASLGMLSAGIAHEIQNPLNFIINFSKVSETLVGELEDTIAEMKDNIPAEKMEEVSEILEDLCCNVQRIKENGERASSIIKGILLYSRGREDEYIPTDLGRLIKEYVNLSYHAMRANNKSFNATICENYAELPPVNIVPQDFSRAILNIMNNACYAVFEKQQKLGESFHPAISIRLEQDGDEAVITVEDNGTGISEETRKEIFKPFYTTKPIGEGTGLGLSITKSIIEQKHGGTIKVESEPGEYCRFIIRIPIHHK